MDAAIAVEYFHTASLIADDLPCMDDDDERRDQLATHKAFDEATAILLSYALIASGYEKLAHGSNRLAVEYGVSQAIVDRITSQAMQSVSVNTGFLGAAGGQYIDLFLPDSSEETIKEVLDKKTVTLFEMSFVLGWLYGGGNHDQLSAVQKLAYHFGMAFQLVDDLGDLEQDALNEASANFASVLGRERALELLGQELSAYNAGLVDLDLETNELKGLGKLLELKADSLRVSSAL